MAKAIMGKEKVLYFRKLGEAESGTLVLQTEHAISASREKETQVTKFGTVAIGSTLEEEVTISAIQASDDPFYKVLEDAVYDDYPLEVWEVDLSKGEGETREAEYRQGYLTSWERTAGEEALTVEGSFTTHEIRQRGTVTLSAEQMADLQYVFHDLTPDDIADDGLASIPAPVSPEGV